MQSYSKKVSRKQLLRSKSRLSWKEQKQHRLSSISRFLSCVLPVPVDVENGVLSCCTLRQSVETLMWDFFLEKWNSLTGCSCWCQDYWYQTDTVKGAVPFFHDSDSGWTMNGVSGRFSQVGVRFWWCPKEGNFRGLLPLFVFNGLGQCFNNSA